MEVPFHGKILHRPSTLRQAYCPFVDGRIIAMSPQTTSISSIPAVRDPLILVPEDVWEAIQPIEVSPEEDFALIPNGFTDPNENEAWAELLAQNTGSPPVVTSPDPKEGLLKRETFKRKVVQQNAFRRDVDRFAEELLAEFCGVTPPDVSGMTRSQRKFAYAEYNRKLSLMKGLLIRYSNDRTDGAFYTVGHHKLDTLRGKKRHSLGKRLHTARQPFFDLIDATFKGIGASPSPDAWTVFQRIMKHADACLPPVDNSRRVRLQELTLQELMTDDTDPSITLVNIDEIELNVDTKQYCQDTEAGIALAKVFIELNPAFSYLLDFDEPDNEPVVEFTVEAHELRQCCACGHMRITTADALEQLEREEKAACDVVEMPA